MPGKTLIIKLGALGDVVRTTPLLRVLRGEIVWVTHLAAKPLLPEEPMIRILDLEAADPLKQEKFDLVLCLDDEPEAARLAASMNTRVLTGTYLDDGGRVQYTPSSGAWFDMGLVSKYGLAKADRLKIENRKTYQEIVFAMLGYAFQNEEYWIRHQDIFNFSFRKHLRIGIEARAGRRWPTKAWHRYQALAECLEKEGMETVFFNQRERLDDYVQDIADCDAVITGDTLAMHLALALKKPVVAIFTCTSPYEIHGYDRMIKVISPFLEKCFYRQAYDPKTVEAVTLDDVFTAFQSLMKRYGSGTKGRSPRKE